MKRVLYTLICASLLFVSCGGKSDPEKPKVSGTVEMYIAVVDGQDQFVKTTVEYTGTDGSPKTINIDGLSFTTTQPKCFAANEEIIYALSVGEKIKYAKIASETGNRCSVTAVFKYAQVATPTEPIDIMTVTGFQPNPGQCLKFSPSDVSRFSKGLKVDKIEDFLKRHTGETATCVVEF